MHKQSSSISLTITSFCTRTLQDLGTMSKLKRTFAHDLDLLEQHLTKEIISQTDCKTILTKLRTTFENAFNSEFKARMQKYTRFDAQSLYDAMIFNMDSIGKYMHEINSSPTTNSTMTDSTVQDDNSMSGNDTDVDDAYIRPIYDEEPMAEIQLTAEFKSPMLDSSPDNQTTEYSKQSLETKFSPKKTSGFEDKPSHRSDLSGNPRVEFSNLLSLSVFLIESFIRALTQQGTSINVQKEQSLDLSAEVHQAAETVTTSNELDLLFGPLFDEYFNGENQVVLKSSAVTTTDASNKRQQQPDSTSSTSTLATTVTANGNFDL
ncbi:hypothetical protein Tco_1234406 [Tanacetum coccineum]